MQLLVSTLYSGSEVELAAGTRCCVNYNKFFPRPLEEWLSTQSAHEKVSQCIQLHNSFVCVYIAYVGTQYRLFIYVNKVIVAKGGRERERESRRERKGVQCFWLWLFGQYYDNTSVLEISAIHTYTQRHSDYLADFPIRKKCTQS